MQERILMVDDALPLHQLLKRQLEIAPIELHSAVDGTRGITLAETLLPGLILLDVDLPDMNGFDVCRELKKREMTVDIPILFLTAQDSPTSVAQGMSLGAAGYVCKPFQVKDLCAKIGQTLNDRRRQEMRAHVDRVTGLGDRSLLANDIESWSDDSFDADRRLSCLAIDLEGLRLINARFGRAAGDAILVDLGKLLARSAGENNRVYSSGAGRFYVVLPDATVSDAARLGERLIDVTRATPLGHAAVGLTLRVSVGAADLVTAAERPIVSRAEDALKLAKLNGGNCIAIARPRRRPRRTAD